MKRSLCLVFIFVFVLLAACSKSIEHSGMNHDDRGAQHSPTAADTTKAIWTISPSKPMADTETHMNIQIQDDKGNSVEKFDISHERQLHLIIVNKNLSYFDHIHPQYKGKGQFQISTTFPAGGDYKLFADYVPTGSAGTTKSTMLTVEGTRDLNAPIEPDQKLVKTVAGKEVTLSYDHLMAGMEVNLNFKFVDEKTRRPITDLQPYLGAVGHVVIISSDLEQYLHVHPTEEKSSGPDAKFMTTFPKSGVYKIWGQFQENGQTFIVPFVVNVP